MHLTGRRTSRARPEADGRAPGRRRGLRHRDGAQAALALMHRLHGVLTCALRNAESKSQLAGEIIGALPELFDAFAAVARRPGLHPGGARCVRRLVGAQNPVRQPPAKAARGPTAGGWQAAHLIGLVTFCVRSCLVQQPGNDSSLPTIIFAEGKTTNTKRFLSSKNNLGQIFWQKDRDSYRFPGSRGEGFDGPGPMKRQHVPQPAPASQRPPRAG